MNDDPQRYRPEMLHPGPDNQNRLPAHSGTLPRRDTHTGLSINVSRTRASTSARLPRPVRSTILSPLDDMDAVARIVDGVNSEFHMLKTEVTAIR